MPLVRWRSLVIIQATCISHIGVIRASTIVRGTVTIGRALSKLLVVVRTAFLISPRTTSVVCIWFGTTITPMPAALHGRGSSTATSMVARGHILKKSLTRLRGITPGTLL